MTTLELIQQFLSEKRIALVGASRDPKEISRGLMRELRGRGMEIVPVNLHASEIDGVPCARTILEVEPKVSSAMVLTPKHSMRQAVLECSSAGISTVWLFGVKGPNEIPADVLELCQSRHMSVIAGYCPYMFLEHAGWFHRLHGSFNKVFRLYPN